MDTVIRLVDVIVWPGVVLAVSLIFKKELSNIAARIHKVNVGQSGVELVLAELERKKDLGPTEKRKLSGLSSHDIWALNDIRQGKIKPEVGGLNIPQRVAAKTMIDAGLIEMKQDGESGTIAVTPLGEEVLRAAESILVIPSTR